MASPTIIVNSFFSSLTTSPSPPQAKSGSDATYLTDAKYTLRTGIAEHRRRTRVVAVHHIPEAFKLHPIPGTVCTESTTISVERRGADSE
jgi:hypothetical protein